MAASARPMHLYLTIMAGLGILVALLGLPILLRPDRVHAFGLQNTPQMTYILRIVGTMATALGLILITFALTYWKAAR